jgi:hypothetical protein
MFKEGKNGVGLHCSPLEQKRKPTCPSKKRADPRRKMAHFYFSILLLPYSARNASTGFTSAAFRDGHQLAKNAVSTNPNATTKYVTGSTGFT